MATAMYAISTERLAVPVHAATDPTGDTVEFAFTADRDTQPGDDDWNPGDWDPDFTVSPYSARILLGAGDDAVPLTAGIYAIWMRITDDPEQPVRQPGLLVVA